MVSLWLAERVDQKKIRMVWVPRGERRINTWVNYGKQITLRTEKVSDGVESEVEVLQLIEQEIEKYDLSTMGEMELVIALGVDEQGAIHLGSMRDQKEADRC